MNEKPGILFVDDEKSFLQSIQRILHKYSQGWNLGFVNSVDEALQELQNEKYDVVVTDIKMPGKDGFDLISILKNKSTSHDIPIIVLTGSDENQLKTQALNLGATDLLNKPLDPAELIARIQNTLNLKFFEDQIKNQNKILEEKVKERTAELENARMDIIWRLAKAGEHRDDATGSHVVRVANYCRLLAMRLGLTQEDIRLIYLTSPLHDIGKIGIPDRILLKRGELSSSQKVFMQRHCEMGADILTNRPTMLLSFMDWEDDIMTASNSKQNPLIKLAASTALTHHEWWDGSGYPQKLSGEDIPLESRIIAIADVYDALRSVRPYKPAYSPEQTLEVMKSEAVNHFDPHIFTVFEQNVDEFQSIWEKSQND
jgi:putative two-component system response regulator